MAAFRACRFEHLVIGNTVDSSVDFGFDEMQASKTAEGWQNRICLVPPGAYRKDRVIDEKTSKHDQRLRTHN
jgi:hypothetical protein